MAIGELKIMTGSANPELATEICNHLGCELTPCLTDTFSDGEIRVEIGSNVRGADVFVVQPTCAPVNFHLMELSIMLDALKRASVGRVTAVVPYYGYARQDRKVAPRAPITAKLVSDFLTVAGIDRLVTVDLHAGQIQGFFNLPVDNLYAAPALLDPLRKYDSKDLVIVSPDAGGVERARAYAKRLGAGLAIIDKRRDCPNQAKAMHVIGDVKGKTAIVVDDMIDTAGTICAGAKVLVENGAKEVLACATHPVLSGPAVERLENSLYKEVFVTNSIPLKDNAKSCSKIKAISLASLLGKAIHNIHTESSVSVLFV
ncbi:ribose-phosphate diphosphokinase [Desulfobaculum bizertense]|uniref:Ribose-phosphate pyrophosphokinase n=1 Tax=Desulfobaculum bizertense DSM 18034 TaxID=1121442 RepID=A0A1T4VUB1_9BACT|nr:ribose-phosphate pyrophosphokinase [Desulfobaculum bizertense]UIJ38480.1 ribose-phosphate pyrophosphokinase [Desulfobaculum bizertense]SKA68418.1 ribose-phosphate pyrophosphokinase [Desulfobaculum bizertense DSM 18034]